MNKILKKINLRAVLGLLLLAVLLGHTLSANTSNPFLARLRIPFLDQNELLVYDARLRATMPKKVFEDIVIVDIDEASLGEIGRWPWSRNNMATLVENLFNQYGVDQVGFDVVMSEPDYSSGLKSLDQLAASTLKDDAKFKGALEKLRPELDYDDRLTKALTEQRAILGYYWAEFGTPGGTLPKPAMTYAELKKDTQLEMEPRKSYGANMKPFQEAAMGGGNFNPTIDPDGNVRRVPMLERHGDNIYESLSLAMVRAYLGNPKPRPIVEEGAGGYAAIEAIVLPHSQTPVRIPVDGDLAALVPYRGGARSFPYVSAADVIKKRAKMDQLVGKMVLIGTTAAGLQDLRATPVGAAYPGVEIHANLIAGIMEDTVKERPQFAAVAEAALMLVIGLLLIFAVPWKSPLKSALATIVALAIVVGINLAAWQYQGWVLVLVPSLVLVTGLFIIGMSLGYFVESRAKKQFTQLFGQYVPPELVDEMSKDPESYTMAGRRKDMTVLFSDVRGFTTISEGMEPEALAALMNEYLGAMTAVIRKHGGTLDKYIGDAIMAFWGAPMENAQHARAGVLAALEMFPALDALNKSLAERGTAPMKIGVGLNTGPMTVGDMGSQIRLSYTVMGDAVNLGSRLEGKTKDYGIGIMVGETTRAEISDIVFRELDCVKVKGKDEPVTVYEPMGLEGTLAPELVRELAMWHEALALYRQKDWDGAQKLLDEIRQTNPNHLLYQLYLERIAEFRVNPPPDDWKGVTKFDTK